MAIWLTAIITVGILIALALTFRHFDRQDQRRTDLVQDAIGAAANGDPRAATALTALIELEYGGFGREHLRRITELSMVRARLELAQVELARLQLQTVVAEESNGSLHRRVLELMPAAKRRLP